MAVVGLLQTDDVRHVGQDRLLNVGMAYVGVFLAAEQIEGHDAQIRTLTQCNAFGRTLTYQLCVGGDDQRLTGRSEVGLKEEIDGEFGGKAVLAEDDQLLALDTDDVIVLSVALFKLCAGGDRFGTVGVTD